MESRTGTTGCGSPASCSRSWCGSRPTPPGSPNLVNGALPPGVTANQTTALPDGTTTNPNTFRLRRARLKTELAPTDYARLIFEIDPTPPMAGPRSFGGPAR